MLAATVVVDFAQNPLAVRIFVDFVTVCQQMIFLNYVSTQWGISHNG